MDRDDELSWMIDLDWRLHGSARNRFFGENVFLARVVERLAEQVCGPWADVPGFLSFAGQPRLDPDVPGPEVAFHADGSPVGTVHERFGDWIRRQARVHHIHIGDPRSITRDEWHDVLADAALTASLGEGARRAIDGIAPLFARMAAAGSIDTYVSKLGGGPQEPLTAEAWRITPDQAVRRTTSCALNAADPFHPEAPIDRLVFVGTRNLDNAIREVARTEYVSVIREDIRIWRPMDDQPIELREAVAFLKTIMTPDNLHLTNADLKAAFVTTMLQEPSRRIFERAKKMVIGQNVALAPFEVSGRRMVK